MAHTDDDTVVAIYIQDLITANKAVLVLDDVLYGRHNNIPHASAAVIIPGGKRRVLAGVSAPGGRTENALMVEIGLHWSKVGDEETERKAVDARATAVERKLHEDVTLGGLIIHGYVVSVERGETQMASGSMFRSVQMVFQGTTKTYLSPPAAPA
jgi:hypothetical protein